MSSHHSRSAYRDELNAARLRIDTLEAELEARRAGEAGEGRALEEAKGKARAFEAKAIELESRVRELERSASERARRAAERSSGRKAASAPASALAASEAPLRGRELAWCVLGLVNLGVLVVLASWHVGAAVALIAVVAGAAASHAFFARLAGRSFGWYERDGRSRRAAKALPAAKTLPVAKHLLAPPPARALKVHPMGSPRLYSTAAPTLAGGLGPRTRLRSKRGRDLARVSPRRRLA